MAEVKEMEFCCEPCASEDKRIPVEGYCEVCKEYLCETCVAVHRKQSMTRCHPIKDKTQMPMKEGLSICLDVCVDICTIHQTEIVKYYCKAHDQTGCGDCMILKHANCNKERLQDVSKDFQETNEFKMVQQGLHELGKEVMATQNAIARDLNTMTAAHSSILQTIASLRNKVNAYLDRKQKQVTEQAEKMKQTDENSLKEVDARNKSLKSELYGLLQKLQISTKNANSLFKVTKEINQRLSTMETEVKQIQQDKSKQQYKLQQHEFIPSTEIERIISDNTPLGKLAHKTHYQSKDQGQVPHQGEKQSNEKPTTKYQGEIVVKDWNDTSPIRIMSSTLLTEDKMVITDYNNKSVKLIDLHKNQLLHIYYPRGIPGCVTAISSTQVAVTMPSNKKIEYLNVNTTLSKFLEIQVGSDCGAISYKNMQLVVFCDDKIVIMNLIGQVLHTIENTSVCQSTTLCPCFIAFGHDNNSVILPSLRTNEVHVIAFNGLILQTYRHHDLQEPSDVVMTDGGVLLVGSSKNDCIHVVSKDFQSSRIILQNDDNLKCPWSFSYCKSTKKLYVCGETIKVFDLKSEILA